MCRSHPRLTKPDSLDVGPGHPSLFLFFKLLCGSNVLSGVRTPVHLGGLLLPDIFWTSSTQQGQCMQWLIIQSPDSSSSTWERVSNGNPWGPSTLNEPGALQVGESCALTSPQVGHYAH